MGVCGRVHVCGKDLITIEIYLSCCFIFLLHFLPFFNLLLLCVCFFLVISFHGMDTKCNVRADWARAWPHNSTKKFLFGLSNPFWRFNLVLNEQSIWNAYITHVFRITSIWAHIYVCVVCIARLLPLHPFSLSNSSPNATDILCSISTLYVFFIKLTKRGDRWERERERKGRKYWESKENERWQEKIVNLFVRCSIVIGFQLVRWKLFCKLH